MSNPVPPQGGGPVGEGPGGGEPGGPGGPGGREVKEGRSEAQLKVTQVEEEAEDRQAKDHQQLKRYFEDVEELLRGPQIFDIPTYVYHAKRYTDSLDTESWIRANIAATTTWDQWKKADVALYPEAFKDQKYSYGDLDHLTQEFREKGIFIKTELGNYHLCFKVISDFLLSKGRIPQT
ncbi:hypothetical protein K474DRAFT_1707184 [Panus rudis PR-1116 ss-1]|nr:hypothetical protein K474DRAFT_1707184 [Panus rudis PR-1116 ss-1]